MEKNNVITIQASINAPIEKVWTYWITPEHIMKWNNASDDWHSPRAENDVRVGKTFTIRMEAKDGSVGFDFEGTYDEVKEKELIVYTLADGRKVNITFTQISDTQTKIVETFEAEQENSLEMQHDGWQAILDNFKQYVEK